MAAVARSASLVAEVGAARLGVAPETLVVDGRTHLRWRLGAGPHRVLVVGHHDTVWPIGTLRRTPYSAVDGVLRGAGCFHMLAGLAPAFQALGLGLVLFRELCAELEARCMMTLWLEVRASNRGAIALYERLNFNEVSIRRNYYPTADGKEDAVMMALTI